MRNCPLCHGSGYRPNGYVCDHVDHEPASRRGMAKVTAVLKTSRTNSVRNTVQARREAYEHWAAVEGRRVEPSSGPPQPIPCPDCGSTEPCEHDGKEQPSDAP